MRHASTSRGILGQTKITQFEITHKVYEKISGFKVAVNNVATQNCMWAEREEEKTFSKREGNEKVKSMEESIAQTSAGN